MTYGAPVWIEAIRRKKNIAKYRRVQRLINIKIAKAYRTISYDASCIIAGVLPINILIEQTVQTYIATKVHNGKYDAPLELTFWRHPSEIPEIREVENGIKYTIEAYTDGSKSGDNVGAAGIIYENGTLTTELKFKLHSQCSNNQAEQIAILKILEKIEEIQNEDNDKSVALYTDSKITLDLLKNNYKRNRLIELIKTKIINLAHSNWKLHFGWIKGHSGIEGNEIADRLAKQAAAEDREIVYDRVPKEVIITQEKEKGIEMWQQQWTDSRNGAISKAYFPSVKNRLRQKIPFFPEFTAIVTGHGKLRAYLHRFRLSDNPICPCGEEEQTADHVVFQCKKLYKERKEMSKRIRNIGGDWPTTHDKLVSKYLQIFVRFISSINFNDLQ